MLSALGVKLLFVMASGEGGVFFLRCCLYGEVERGARGFRDRILKVTTCTLQVVSVATM